MPMLTVRRAKILWRITAHVVDYKAFGLDSRPLNNMGEIMDRDAVNTSFGDVKAGSSPIFQPVGIVTEGKTEIDYIINFGGLDGTWTEEMHYKRLNGNLEYANRVLWQDVPPSGNVDQMKKTVVFKEVSKGYPLINGQVE